MVKEIRNSRSLKHKSSCHLKLHPIIWTPNMEVHFIMSKLTREQKSRIYEKRKQGRSISSLSKEYAILIGNVKYLIRLLDKHGESILRKDKNKYYPPALKEEIINRVLLQHHSVKSTAIEYGLSSDGTLIIGLSVKQKLKMS